MSSGDAHALVEGQVAIVTGSGFITGVTLAIDGGAVAAGAYMVEKYRRRKAADVDAQPPQS